MFRRHGNAAERLLHRLLYLLKCPADSFTLNNLLFRQFPDLYFGIKCKYVVHLRMLNNPKRVFFFFVCSRACNLSGAKSNHLFPLIHPDRMSDLRNNSQFRLKIPVQLRVIWFPCSPEIYMYSAYQLDYWQVGRITQFEVTCFSRCSIQCHIALEEGGYCFVGWMRNFLAPPFPDLAAHLFTCCWVFLFGIQCKCAAIR